jgi:hypothetical protein
VGTKSSPSKPSGTGGGKKPNRKPPRQKRLVSEHLKRHYRWVFIVLALVFAFSFILFGVGNSGGFGLNDVLRGGGGSGGSNTDTTVSASDLSPALAATKKSPQDPAAWSRLGAAYSAQASTQTSVDAAIASLKQSVAAYEKANTLKPNDVPTLTSLADAYDAEAAAIQGQVQQIYQQASDISSAADTSVFLPQSAPVDPLTDAAAQQRNSQVQALYAKAGPLSTEATALSKKSLAIYQQLVKLQPNDAALWFREAQAANAVGDKATAIAGFQRFLALVPGDPLAPAVKTEIDNLIGTTTAATTTTQSTATTKTSTSSTSTTSGTTTSG